MGVQAETLGFGEMSLDQGELGGFPNGRDRGWNQWEESSARGGDAGCGEDK